jgi:hypothetical protein
VKEGRPDARPHPRCAPSSHSSALRATYGPVWNPCIARPESSQRSRRLVGRTYRLTSSQRTSDGVLVVSVTSQFHSLAVRAPCGLRLALRPLLRRHRLRNASRTLATGGRNRDGSEIVAGPVRGRTA